jgi:hypothetical protein
MEEFEGGNSMLPTRSRWENFKIDSSHFSGIFQTGLAQRNKKARRLSIRSQEIE